MPIYRTAPDVSLDDVVAQIESGGEEIIDVTFLSPGEWVIVTKPKPYDGNFRIETRSA